MTKLGDMYVDTYRLVANEEPMAASKIQRKDKAKVELGRTTGFDIYGSAKIRYREQGGETGWQDSGSRLGAGWICNFYRNTTCLGVMRRDLTC